MKNIDIKKETMFWIAVALLLIASVATNWKDFIAAGGVLLATVVLGNSLFNLMLTSFSWAIAKKVK
jgi:hypothetical protein